MTPPIDKHETVVEHEEALHVYLESLLTPVEEGSTAKVEVQEETPDGAFLDHCEVEPIVPPVADIQVAVKEPDLPENPEYKASATKDPVAEAPANEKAVNEAVVDEKTVNEPAASETDLFKAEARTELLIESPTPPSKEVSETQLSSAPEPALEQAKEQVAGATSEQEPEPLPVSESADTDAAIKLRPIEETLKIEGEIPLKPIPETNHSSDRSAAKSEVVPEVKDERPVEEATAESKSSPVMSESQQSFNEWMISQGAPTELTQTAQRKSVPQSKPATSIELSSGDDAVVIKPRSQVLAEQRRKQAQQELGSLSSSIADENIDTSAISKQGPAEDTQDKEQKKKPPAAPKAVATEPVTPSVSQEADKPSTPIIPSAFEKLNEQGSESFTSQADSDSKLSHSKTSHSISTQSISTQSTPSTPRAESLADLQMQLQAKIQAATEAVSQSVVDKPNLVVPTLKLQPTIQIPDAETIAAPEAKQTAEPTETSTQDLTLNEREQQLLEREKALELREKALAVSRPEINAPEWAVPDFQCLLFNVSGLTLAIPLHELNAIIEWDPDAITAMPGHAAWHLGVMRHREMNSRIIDTMQQVMPEKRRKRLADQPRNLQRIIMIDQGRWGLACDEILEVITLSPEQVKWRSERTKRKWLLGTVVDHMCALIDSDSFANMLNTGEDSLFGTSEPLDPSKNQASNS